MWNDDVIKWKHFLRFWPFLREIHRSLVNSLHKWPVTHSFDVFYDLCLNKQLSKQSWGWWFETLSRPLWRHRNGDIILRWMAHILIYDKSTFYPVMTLCFKAESYYLKQILTKFYERLWYNLWVNTLRPGPNGRHFADDAFKCIFWNENIRISIGISLKFVSYGSN